MASLFASPVPPSIAVVSPKLSPVGYPKLFGAKLFTASSRNLSSSISIHRNSPSLLHRNWRYCVKVPNRGSEIDEVSISDRDSISLRGLFPKMASLERDFTGTRCVFVYVKLPPDVINIDCELVNPDRLREQLAALKSIRVDGVKVDCWWGIVERDAPKIYNWSGYKRLFEIVRSFNLRLEVALAFHEGGGNDVDDVRIPLPRWVMEIGQSNPDIFFTDKEGRRNTECLTWGIDLERVLDGRLTREVYFDFMNNFSANFGDFFKSETISKIEIGLGPGGELRYPSHPARHGWRYPGIGEFQCYDKYLMDKWFIKATISRGGKKWATVPDNAGSYNSFPQDTEFFCDRGDYDGFYGRFFLNWYSRVLLDHGRLILSFARISFYTERLGVKLPGVHWWYNTDSHAAELTAGYYNTRNRDGYVAIAEMLHDRRTALNLACVKSHPSDQHEDFRDALANPKALAWQIANAAWDINLGLTSEEALDGHRRDCYREVLESVKPGETFFMPCMWSFTYRVLSPELFQRDNFLEFERFVKQMHGHALTN